MRIDSKSFRVLSGLVVAGCLFSACGGDEPGDDDASAGEGGSAGSSAGSKAGGGAGKGGGSGKGGTGSGGTATGGTNASGGAGGDPGSSGGAVSEAGAGGEGNASASGGEGNASASGGEGNESAGAGSGGSAGEASNPAFDDCETPGPSVEYCYAENDDRPGTAVCSEYYVSGAAALFCDSPQPGGCPRSSELEGVCVGGITSSYYYADPTNEGFWDATEPGCEINGGTWCSD